MKKIILTLCIVGLTHCLLAQSIFPADGSNVGIGTTTPPRKLTVSNSGAEGLEIGPGNLVGDPAGAVTSVITTETPAHLLITYRLPHRIVSLSTV